MIAYLLSHLWHIGFGVSILWSLGSFAWSVRVERALRRLRVTSDKQGTQIRYLQTDENGFHETTPTVHLRVVRRVS